MLEAGSQPTVQAGSQPTVGAASDEDICEWAFGGDDEGGACLFALEENKKDVRPRYLPYLYSLLYATAWPHQPQHAVIILVRIVLELCLHHVVIFLGQRRVAP